MEKYNIAVPRYTSYPTVPSWNTKEFKVEEYLKTVQTAYWSSAREISIYIHLPFCESLCTYCACNTRITKNHDVEEPYIANVLKEWELYVNEMPERPTIREIHLGGGTPTFFSPKNLENLISGIVSKGIISDQASFSFEGHPANTTEDHLKVLFEMGFDRLSLGIQDFDLNVQRLINRLQTLDQVRKVTEVARELGYKSINYDMVYGLPGQTIDSLEDSLKKVSELAPDRIAFYSYAHIPALKPAQRSFAQFLPEDSLKLQFMNLGKERLGQFGYKEVGMDHFVLPDDELLEARKNKELHRNFMGYTPYSSKLLIGLGVSAIGDSWSGFTQNEKTIEAYSERLKKQELPISKGHILTIEDLFFRKHILNIMCQFQTTWNNHELMEYGLNLNLTLLQELEKDGMISLTGNSLKVLPKGREYVRVVCSALDASLNSTKSKARFSKSF